MTTVRGLRRRSSRGYPGSPRHRAAVLADDPGDLRAVHRGRTRVLHDALPLYSSSATINLLPKAGGAAGQLKAALDYAQDQAGTYAQLAGTLRILEPAAKKVPGGESAGSLGGSCRTEASPTQAVIFVSCTRRDPESPATMANAIADQILIALDEFSPRARIKRSGRSSPTGPSPTPPRSHPTSRRPCPWR